MNSRMLPHDPAAEAAVLGSMIVDPTCITDGVKLLSRDAFSDEPHQLVYDAVMACHQAGAVDGLTVRVELERRGQLDAIGGVEYLQRILDTVPSSANAGWYAKIVREMYRRRQAIVAGERLASNGYDLQLDIGDQLREAQADVADIRSSDGDDREIQVVNAATWLTIDPPAPEQIITDVFDRGDKVCILGSSKLRKSFLLLQMVISLAAGKSFLGRDVPKPRRILHVQFEIQGHHFQRRVRHMARALGITPADIEDRLQIVNARGRGLVGAEAISRIREMAKPFSPDIICFDPLYKVSSGVENAAEGLKLVLDAFDFLAEETGACILFVHHDAKGNSGDRDIRDRGAGSNVLGRDYDACLTLTPHASEEGCVVVETLLRNYRPQDPFAIEWSEDITTGGYSFTLRPDVAPTKKTSATSRKDTTPFDALIPVALSLVKIGPLAIGEFRERLRTKAGLTFERLDAFVKWVLLESDPQLDVFECRRRGQHQKLVGTPEQIARARVEAES